MEESRYLDVRIRKIRDLAAIEAKGINMLLDRSERAGISYLHDVVGSFVDFLRQEKDLFVPSLDVEYRTFITALLRNIKPEHQPLVTFELISPKA